MAKLQTCQNNNSINKISGLVYNIRMQKYNERVANIKEILPVLESRLKKLS